jgi:hypothetical protein
MRFIAETIFAKGERMRRLVTEARTMVSISMRESSIMLISLSRECTDSMIELSGIPTATVQSALAVFL